MTAANEKRKCQVCGLEMVQQYPNDPKRDWYWYCPSDGFFSHIRAKNAASNPAVPSETE